MEYHLPGGAEYLRLNPKELDILRQCQQSGRGDLPRCAVTGRSGCPKVGRCSAHPACSPEEVPVEGKFAEIAFGAVVADGSLVTTPAWPAHLAWIGRFPKVLGTRIWL